MSLQNALAYHVRKLQEFRDDTLKALEHYTIAKALTKKVKPTREQEQIIYRFRP